MTSTPETPREDDAPAPAGETIAPAADAVTDAADAPAPDEAGADPRLIDARDLALAALHEITPASTVGPPAGYLLEEGGPVSLRFENRLPGYPGWYWTVTLAAVGDAEPTVLEIELLPGDGALVAPEWVPWADRLAEYRAQAARLAEEAAAAADAEEDSDEDDEDDLTDQRDIDDDYDDGLDFDFELDADDVDLDEDDVSVDDDDAADDEEADVSDDDE